MAATIASLPSPSLATNPYGGNVSDPNGVPLIANGGQSSAINITAAQTLKGSAGRLVRIVITSPGTAGSWAFSDTPSATGGTSANLIWQSAYNGTESYEGAVIELEWPCISGISATSVPTGGVANVSFN